MEPPQFNIRHVEAYRQDLCDQADLLLVNEIPSQLRKVEEILAGVRLKSGYQQTARTYCVESIEAFKEKLEEIQNAQRSQQADMEKALEMLFGKAKPKDDNVSAEVQKSNSKIKLEGKRKRNSKGVVLESNKSNVSVELKITDSAKKVTSISKTSQASEEDDNEEISQEIPDIEVNEKVNELFMELKPLILRLAEHCLTLRNWIVILIPKAEDGNNFGVEVQEHCLAKLIEVEKNMNMILEEHAAYHLERATILGKIMSNGEVMDYTQYIYDADERQCRKLQDIAHSLRSSYNSVHHMLTNNYDRITAPRGESVNHLHLY